MRLIVIFGVSVFLFAFKISNAEENHQTIEQGDIEYTPGVMPVNDKFYEEECGACHMVYPAGFLPANTWVKIMHNLDAHFGGNAELDKEEANKLVGYLQKYSADKSSYRYSVKVMQSISAEVVVNKITDVPYIIQKHAKISPLLIATKVGSLSNCNRCHRKSAQGFFTEQDTRIPGFDKFD